jgi:hypothetical protein
LEDASESILFFYYYSGHGYIENKLTCGVNKNNEKIPIEEWVRKISKYERTYTIAIFDCERKK